MEAKAVLKAGRPNSCTVYPLRYIRDINNQACWEIVGYSDPEEEYWEPEILYSINELPIPSEILTQMFWEETGSLDHMNDPDLTLDTLFMTSDPEGFTDPYVGRIQETGTSRPLSGRGSQEYRSLAPVRTSAGITSYPDPKITSRYFAYFSACFISSGSILPFIVKTVLKSTFLDKMRYNSYNDHES